MIGNEYSQDFQIKLLINLLLSQRFFDATVGQLRVEDFGTPACRLIYETARNYRAQYRRLPPFPSLETEVIRAMADTTGNVITRLEPSDMESLGVIMGWIANTRTAELDPDYYSSRLPGFIAFVRLSVLQGQQATSTVNDFIASVSNLQSQLASIGSTQYQFYDIMTPIPEELGSARPRLGWGVPRIDAKLGGGLTAQQSGLVVACTGVGKTTTMLGIEVHAAFQGKHSLFITCELPRHKIMERGQMMIGCIEAKWFKIPQAKWPPDIKARWNMIASPDSPLQGSVTVIEKIGNCTVFDIDSMIFNWKERIAQQGKNPADCAIVAVDWLDRIDPSGISRLSKGDNEERQFFRVFEKLDELKTKHDLIVWTATQAGKTGEGKEVLSRKDTSYGQSKHHLADFSMGVAPKAPGREEANVEDEFVTNTANPNEDASMQGTMIEPPCDRELVISYMKTRDTSTQGQHTNVYQGPTLKLWENRQASEFIDRIAKKGDVRGMFESLLGHRLKGTTNAQPVTVGGVAQG